MNIKNKKYFIFNFEKYVYVLHDSVRYS